MRLANVLAVSMLVAATAGCDEKLSDVTGPTPDLEVSFASIQQEIFNTTDSSGRASCIQCHTAQGRNPAGGLNLMEGVSYAALVNVASSQKAGEIRVIPGNPDASYLVRKLEGGPNIVLERMPRTGGPYLTEGQMRVIRRWIELGAENN
jgi:mono/diheme cytochrome c family protein